LVLGVGVIGFFMGFIPHVFFADAAAPHWLADGKPVPVRSRNPRRSMGRPRLPVHLY
jgi:hypothetical protein